jgi:hypothetical protein
VTTTSLTFDAALQDLLVDLSSTADTEVRLHPGTRLGPYRVLSEVARGGMGVVYRGEHVDTGGAVALKTLRAARTAHAMALACEADALRRLSHPGVVRQLDADLSGSRPWLALAWLPGPSLAAAWPPPPTDRAEALRRLGQVAAAVAHLHGRGVVHGDLKPDNLLLDAVGRPVIIDFGLARSARLRLLGEDLTRATRAGLTARYASPEQVRGEPFDARTDVFALGVMLHEALTGLHPSEATSGDSDGWTPALQACSHPIAGLVAAALHPEVDRRTTSPAALARALGATLPVGPPVASSGFVGRDAELGFLLARLDEARGGHGRTVVVHGEAGVGKSALLRALVQRVRPRAHVIHGSAAALGDLPGLAGIPLHAPREILGTLLTSHLLDGPAGLKRVFRDHHTALSALLPTLPRALGVEAAPEPPPGSLLGGWQALVDALDAARGDRPLILCIEDVQWADDATIGLMRHLREQAATRPWLLLSTARARPGTDPTPWLPEAARIALAPLPISPRAQAFLQRAKHQLACLPDDSRHLARRLALLGETFTAELALRLDLPEGGPGDAARRLSELLHADIIEEEASGRLCYAHPELREHLLLEGRPEEAAAVAGTLEEVGADPALCAGLWLRGGRLEQALGALERTLQAAIDRQAPREAWAILDLLVRTAARIGAGRRADAARCLVLEEIAIPRADRERGLALADALSDSDLPALRARAAVGRAAIHVHHPGQSDVKGALEDAGRQLDAFREPDLQARLALSWSSFWQRSGNRAAAREVLERFLDGPARPSVELRVLVGTNLALLEAQAGERARAELRYADLLAELGERAPAQQARIWLNRGANLCYLDELAHGAFYLERATALARRAGDPRMEALSLRNRATLARTGTLDDQEALARLSEVLRLTDLGGLDSIARSAWMERALILGRTGQHAAARDALARAGEGTPPADRAIFVSACLDLWSGRVQAAAEALEGLVARLPPGLAGGSLARLGQARWQLGERAEAVRCWRATLDQQSTARRYRLEAERGLAEALAARPP